MSRDAIFAWGIASPVLIGAVVVLIWMLYTYRKTWPRKRPTTNEDFIIGANEQAVVIRVDERGLPTQAQGKGMLPAQVAMCCFVVAHNLSMQLTEDIARTAGYGMPQPAPPPGVPSHEGYATVTTELAVTR